MRSTSEIYRALIPYSHAVVTEVTSWLGGVQLAAVPIVGGKIAFDDTAVVKRRLTLTVPARTPERRWDPAGDASAPLAAYGQRLHVRTGLAHPGGTVELLDLGWYLITGWKRSEEAATISVEALDLSRLLVDDRLPHAESPPAAATFASEFRRLVEPTLAVSIPGGFPDRAVSATAVWERDRDKALADLCAAWPARWYVDDTGTARVAAPYAAVSDATTPDLVLTDGQAGTVVARARQADRGALYNRVVVDGKAPDDTSAAPHAVADITAPSSPIRVGGPYGRVPRFYSSDLLTTQAQADAAAASLLVTYSSVGRSEPVKTIPDPAVQLGDVARVYTRDGDRYTARVDHITLPLTVADGTMDLALGMLPAGTV